MLDTMAKRDVTEEHLARLADLRREADIAVVHKELKAALGQKRSALVVAKAAELVVELGDRGRIMCGIVCDEPSKEEAGG